MYNFFHLSHIYNHIYTLLEELVMQTKYAKHLLHHESKQNNKLKCRILS